MNSILDQAGDVVLFHDTTATYLFRDNVEHGLIVTAAGNGWTLTREGETTPVVTTTYDWATRTYVARTTSGHVLNRTQGQYGLMAKLARRYLTISPAEQARIDAAPARHEV